MDERLLKAPTSVPRPPRGSKTEPSVAGWCGCAGTLQQKEKKVRKTHFRQLGIPSIHSRKCHCRWKSQIGVESILSCWNPHNSSASIQLLRVRGQNGIHSKSFYSIAKEQSIIFHTVSCTKTFTTWPKLLALPTAPYSTTFTTEVKLQVEEGSNRGKGAFFLNVCCFWNNLASPKGV